MIYKIVISVIAKAQLEDLYDYIAEATSSAAALRFTSAILDQLGSLETFPNLGVARNDVLLGLRTLAFRRRVTIAFVVEPNAVLIVGIFYGGQDFETALKADS